MQRDIDPNTSAMSERSPENRGIKTLDAISLRAAARSERSPENRGIKTELPATPTSFASERSPENRGIKTELAGGLTFPGYVRKKP